MRRGSPELREKEEQEEKEREKERQEKVEREKELEEKGKQRREKEEQEKMQREKELKEKLKVEQGQKEQMQREKEEKEKAERATEAFLQQAKQIAASLQNKLAARSKPVLKVELEKRKDLPLAMVYLAEADTLTQLLSLQPPGSRIGSVEVERIEPASNIGTKTCLVKWKGRKDALNEDALLQHFNALLTQAHARRLQALLQAR